MSKTVQSKAIGQHTLTFQLNSTKKRDAKSVELKQSHLPFAGPPKRKGKEGGEEEEEEDEERSDPKVQKTMPEMLEPTKPGGIQQKKGGGKKAPDPPKKPNPGQKPPGGKSTSRSPRPTSQEDGS